MKSTIVSLIACLVVGSSLFSLSEDPASSDMIHVTENNYEALIQSSKGVVIDVYASWCGPCKRMEPIFQQAFEAYGSQCQFAKLSTEEAYSLCERLRVRSIPTFVFFRNGKELGRVMGFRSYEQFSGDLAQYLQVQNK